MPNRLRDLTITEISLVDRPANAETDPATGEKISRATVALFKRDDSQPKEKVMTPPLKLSQIRKSADHLTFSREAIAAAVFNKAQKIAKKRNISVEEAEARVWKKNPIVVALYDCAPTPILKREPRTAMTTEAEGELDTRARRRMQKFGESYAKACERELADHPGLYTRYEAEKAAGSLFAAPEYVDTKMDIDNDIDPDDDEDAAVPDNSRYGRRAQATANNDLVDQQRKNKNKMRW